MIRQSKVKGSKQGIILVMVLLIVAMAMIFISAALLLTNSTRTRLYNNAESGQARLTVTAASEAMYQAIQIQEITDAELKQLAKGSYLTLKVNGVAGMGDAADNCTHVHVYEKYKTEKDPITGEPYNCQYIYMDFTTTIGTSEESVQMILKGPGPDDDVSLFSNVIDLAGTTGDQNQAQFNIGTGGTGKDDNMVVIRGSGKKYMIDRDNQNIASTHVFVGEKESESIDVWLRDSTYTGDLIFFGDYATLHWDLQPKINGNVYFIGKNNKKAFTDVGSASRSFGSSKSTWVFVNRVANGDTDRVQAMLTGKECVLLLDGDSFDDLKWDKNNATNVSGLTDKWTGKDTIKDATGRGGIYGDGKKYNDIKKALEDYMSATYTGKGAYPTTTKALGSLATATGATQYSASSFLTNFAYDPNDSKKQVFLKGGTYRISDGSSGSVAWNTSNKNSKSEMKYIFLDGSDKDGYNIYLASDYDMTGVMFVLLNGSKKTKCNIILEKNADLSLGYSNFTNNGYYGTGFVSVSATGYDTPTAFYNVLDTLKMSSRTSSAYNGSVVPHMFIYGVGNNHITFGSSGGAQVVCEAYVGLFEDKYPGTSVLEFNNQPVYFYGRIQAPKLIAQTNSNNNTVRYCPDPNSGKEDSNEPLKSQFSVYDVIYYYNAGSAETE